MTSNAKGQDCLLVLTWSQGLRAREGHLLAGRACRLDLVDGLAELDQLPPGPPLDAVPPTGSLHQQRTPSQPSQVSHIPQHGDA